MSFARCRRRKTRAELARELVDMLGLQDPALAAWTLRRVSVCTLESLCERAARSLGREWRPYK